jgi:uncharacterized protein (TIGR02246 family)
MIDDDAALRELVHRADRAQSDPEALLALHHPDAAVVNIAGRRVLGTGELRSAMTAALASSLRDVRTSVEIVDIRRPAPDVGVISCIKTVHDERQEGAALPTTGALTYVAAFTGGEWRIVLAQTTPIAGGS